MNGISCCVKKLLRGMYQKLSKFLYFYLYLCLYRHQCDTQNYNEYPESESDVEEIEGNDDPFINW